MEPVEKEQQKPTSIRGRLGWCIVTAMKPALRTGLWLLAITVPVSFVVLIMKVTGLLHIIAGLFEPVFSLFSLPGESALVFVTACFLNIYSCIVVADMLELSTRAMTILALMCLISHNLPVESAVQKKTGSSFLRIIVTRLLASFVGAFVLNLLLPPETGPAAAAAAADALAVGTFGAEFKAWLAAASILCAKIMVLVTLLMILERVMDEFGVTKFLSYLLKYPLICLGVPPEAAILWVVANTLGLAYGAGVIVDHVERGLLSRKHADILNHHIAISHSLIEDTCLFVVVGVSAWWITIPRVILAGIAVWLKRLTDHFSRGSESLEKED